MSIFIGNARGGNSTYSPGDQTGAEVRTLQMEWVNKRRNSKWTIF